MSKPIEPGCLCLVKAGRNAGKSVIVVERGNESGITTLPNRSFAITTPGECWVVEGRDLEFETADGEIGSGDIFGCFTTKMLARIDDYEPQQTKQKEEVLC